MQDVRYYTDSIHLPHTVYFTRGEKRYEVTDHRGNVMAVVSDKKTGTDGNNDGVVNYYVADVVSATDYSSYGAALEGRELNADVMVNGFDGQRRDRDIQKDHHTAEFWEYDSRIGRRWNVDPILKIAESPYLCFSGNPILLADHDGADPSKPKDPGKSEGDRESTSETTYASLHNTPKTVTAFWNWHGGGIKDAKGNISEAGWYSDAEYGNILTPLAAEYSNLAGKKTNIGTQLSGYQSGELAKFAANGLSVNTATFLVEKSKQLINKFNSKTVGTITPTSFNVEDMLVVGMVVKQSIKGLSGLALKTLGANSSRALVSLSEETFIQALFKGSEKIGEYSIFGTKGLVGSTFNRNIFLIETQNKSLAGFTSLLKTMEAEAINSGANNISIYGSSVINKGFLNPNIAARFGYSFEQSGTGVILQKVLKH